VNSPGKRDTVRNRREFEVTKNEITNSVEELNKSAVWSFGTCRFSCKASYFSFSLAGRARSETSHLPTKSRKAN